MTRKRRDDEASFGSDSFMDVVTNVVGILITLVLVVGMRIKQAPLDELTRGLNPPDLDRYAVALKKEESTSAALRAQLDDLQRQRTALADETRRLATQEEQRRRDADLLRDEQSAAETERQLLQSDLATAKAYLEQLDLDIALADARRPQTVRIDSYPTPLARTVEGSEFHFQLREGRIVFIPVEELIDEMRSDVRQQVWKLRDSPEASGTVGPIGGFRMRYTIERVDVPSDEEAGRRRVASYAQLALWTLVPIDSRLGETLEVALGDGSAFLQRIAQAQRRKATITIWTYPESFAEFRELKRELYAQGFSVAARPLPPGHPIGGSPVGSKSAAQ